MRFVTGRENYGDSLTKISTYGRNVHRRYPTGDVVVSEHDLAEQLRKHPIAVSMGQIPELQPEMAKGIHGTSPANIAEYMAAISCKGGQTGGKRRLKTMAKTQRSKIAAKFSFSQSFHHPTIANQNPARRQTPCES